MKTQYEKLYLLVLDDMEKKYSHLRNKGIKIKDLEKETKDFKNVKTDLQFSKKLAEKFVVFDDLHVN